jgi:hypothetical protein
VAHVRQAALALVTGLAANRSFETGVPVQTADVPGSLSAIPMLGVIRTRTMPSIAMISFLRMRRRALERRRVRTAVIDGLVSRIVGPMP